MPSPTKRLAVKLKAQREPKRVKGGFRVIVVKISSFPVREIKVEFGSDNPRHGYESKSEKHAEEIRWSIFYFSIP